MARRKHIQMESENINLKLTFITYLLGSHANIM